MRRKKIVREPFFLILLAEENAFALQGTPACEKKTTEEVVVPKKETGKASTWVDDVIESRENCKFVPDELPVLEQHKKPPFLFYK